MTEERHVIESVVIDTTRELAYEALTRAGELRGWFGDEAHTEPRPGGRYDVWWKSGYRAAGRFVEVEELRRATITWRGLGEPAETAVEFQVTPVEQGVEITVRHSGIGAGAEWDSFFESAPREWALALENLKSTLETGVDLRIARVPFLGILIDYLDAARAAKEGIAVDRGVYVGDTLEDTAARATGLRHGDVIVAIDGAETVTFDQLSEALRSHRAGDTVVVHLVRGAARVQLPLVLGQRPQGHVPAAAGDLAAQLSAAYSELDDALGSAVEGLTEEQAGQAPALGEWSVKQVLAHLSTGERGTHLWLWSVAVGDWPDGDGGDANTTLHQLAAVLSVTPALEGLLARFRADQAETEALLRELPEVTLAHKARFRRLAEAVGYLPNHVRDHVAQIQATVQAVREA
jgi:uncharacterized protein YndB with AHSA1/START domain